MTEDYLRLFLGRLRDTASVVMGTALHRQAMARTHGPHMSSPHTQRVVVSLRVGDLGLNARAEGLPMTASSPALGAVALLNLRDRTAQKCEELTKRAQACSAVLAALGDAPIYDKETMTEALRAEAMAATGKGASAEAVTHRMRTSLELLQEQGPSPWSPVMIHRALRQTPVSYQALLQSADIILRRKAVGCTCDWTPERNHRLGCRTLGRFGGQITVAAVRDESGTLTVVDPLKP